MRLPKTRQILEGVDQALLVFRFFDVMVLGQLRNGSHFKYSIFDYNLDWYQPENRAISERDIICELELENQDIEFVPYLRREISQLNIPADVYCMATSRQNAYCRAISNLVRDGVIDRPQAKGIISSLKAGAIVITRWVGVIQKSLENSERININAKKKDSAKKKGTLQNTPQIYRLISQKSKDQLKTMFHSLVEDKYISGDKPDAIDMFLDCFDNDSKRQGHFDWICRSEKNQNMDKQALCLFLEAHGISRGNRGKNWIEYARTLAGVEVSEEITKHANNPESKTTFAHAKLLAIVQA